MKQTDFTFLVELCWCFLGWKMPLCNWRKISCRGSQKKKWSLRRLIAEWISDKAFTAIQWSRKMFLSLWTFLNRFLDMEWEKMLQILKKHKILWHKLTKIWWNKPKAVLYAILYFRDIANMGYCSQLFPAQCL